MKIKKIALISSFLDEGDEIELDDSYMENFICQDDHFYHRIAKSLTLQGLEPVIFYPSVVKPIKEFKHKFGHSVIRIPAIKPNNKLLYTVNKSVEIMKTNCSTPSL